MANVSKIRDYKVTSGDCFFFDNNIWMYLFASIAGANSQKQKVYSSFLREIQSARATIFISSLILSEYTNRCLRLSFGQWVERNALIGVEYKRDYRGTDDFKASVETIEEEIKAIMALCEKTPDNFNAINLDDVLKNMNSCDFNDSYYIELCKIGKFKLVTDDADMLSISDKIEIITM